MITELRYTLEARLAGDALLDALLDRDPNVPDTPRPAILYSHLGSAPPPLTCLTYRLTTLTPDSRFRPAIPAVSPYAAADGSQTAPAVDATSPITDIRLDLEFWTLEHSGAGGEAVQKRLFALLDNQAWPVLNKGGQPVARVFKGGCLTAQLSDYDDNLNSQFALFSFLLRVSEHRP